MAGPLQRAPLRLDQHRPLPHSGRGLLSFRRGQRSAAAVLRLCYVMGHLIGTRYQPLISALGGIASVISAPMGQGNLIWFFC